MITDLNAKYWDERYKAGYTGWDIGFPSTPLVTILDNIKNKECRILIPGAGNSYEAEYAYNLGFSNVIVLDFAASALRNLKLRIPSFPDSHLIEQDFFEHQGQYDLILEQTFFCALNPSLREEYVSKVAELLAPGGRLMGVLFDTEFEKEGPPFGGKSSDYEELFRTRFENVSIEECINSIPPRMGKEVTIEIKK